ncbi:hypothetical protein, variant [Sphaeroforma arctica JP610]|nr:hypothetical protein, variant [Sphaeroforma arctica JP610]KNC78838.1 hypothetical protein, variant [Sphaeroforma arctica JP610]|eukprot:XP_014152740.1 hypothetical protein, variant [Sphaeroforma arctica JP610]
MAAHGGRVSVSPKEQFIDSIQLLKERPCFFQTAVWPFAGLYGVLLYVGFQEWETLEDDAYWQLFKISIAVVVVTQLFVYLGTHWSRRFKARVCYWKSDSLVDSTHVFVSPRGVNVGRNQIVPIKVDATYSTPDLVANSSRIRCSIHYEHMKYLCLEDEVSKQISLLPLAYPDSMDIESYRQRTGLCSREAIKTAYSTYGGNRFDIPLPSFSELLLEQALAPFFIFQVFCVVLWSLDEYVYYSLLTLVMLVFFECTVVSQRRRNMESLLLLSAKPHPIRVYRAGSWAVLASHRLLPGDVVAIEPDVHKRGDMPIPCDILLLSGTCITNEAMLTGEGKPRQKESPIWNTQIASANIVQGKTGPPLGPDPELPECLGITDRHAGNVLFGGTTIVHSSGVAEGLRTYKDLSIPPPPPLYNFDRKGGSEVEAATVKDAHLPCIGYVMRTGFATKQGQLVRKILFSTQRVTANNKESFVFILFLLVFAIVAAAYVWVQRADQQDTALAKAIAAREPMATNTAHEELIGDNVDEELEGRWRIVLECLLIITSVVPPELPMELSLAVNSSMARLQRLAIFCTEPFRIPLAGKVNVCCFDKTGTLTSDKLDIEGVVVDMHSTDEIRSEGAADIQGNAERKNEESIAAMVKKGGILPEASVMVLAGCHSASLTSAGKIVADPLESAMLRFANAAPQHDGSILIQKSRKDTDTAYVVKILKKFSFNSLLKRMTTIITMNGELFIVSKGAPEMMSGLLDTIPPHYNELYNRYAASGYRVLAMAAAPLPRAMSTNIGTLDRATVETNLEFAGFLIVSCELKPETKPTIRTLRETSHAILMITGDSPMTACHVAREASFLRKSKPLYTLSEHLNSGGKEVLQLFGTGQKKTTSDVFATLRDEKAALCVTGKGLERITSSGQIHKLIRYIVVYARTSPVQKEQIIELLNARGHHTLMCGDGTNDVAALKAAVVGVALVDGGVGRDFGKAFGGRARAVAYKGVLHKVKGTNSTFENDGMGDGSEMCDATYAASFTSKIPSPLAVLHIIRHGRTTFATTLQMYKILAINCLVHVYSLSFLYLEGVKFSDW